MREFDETNAFFFDIEAGRFVNGLTRETRDRTKKIPFDRLIYLTDSIDLDFLDDGSRYKVLVVTDVDKMYKEDVEIYKSWLTARYHHLKNKRIEQRLFYDLTINSRRRVRESGASNNDVCESTIPYVRERQ